MAVGQLIWVGAILADSNIGPLTNMCGHSVDFPRFARQQNGQLRRFGDLPSHGHRDADRWVPQLEGLEMAHRVGLSKAQLSQIELGKSWPSFPTLKRITEELDQPFSQLFKEVEQTV